MMKYMIPMARECWRVSGMTHLVSVALSVREGYSDWRPVKLASSELFCFVYQDGNKPCFFFPNSGREIG